MMSTTTVTVRLPKELKAKMMNYKSHIDWNDEIRQFISKRIKQLEKEEALRRIRKKLESIPPAPAGTAARLVREDRDRH